MYSNDADLVYLRPNILNNGQDDFSWAHKSAYETINATLEAEWYISVANSRGINPYDVAMDPTRLVPTELKQLSVFKALELIYISLSKDIAPTQDGPFQWAAWANAQYKDEMERILKVGPSYDWDDDGIDQKDRFDSFQRRIIRC